MTKATFTGMHTVAVPVTNQERTKALFEHFGLQTRLDTELQPGFRWIEMALADSRTSIALVQAGPQLPTGIDTGIRLTTPDARAAHAAVIHVRLIRNSSAGPTSGPWFPQHTTEPSRRSRLPMNQSLAAHVRDTAMRTPI